jgi:hypothetical protein
MAKRTIQRDPELLAHQEWLGYLQPVGLVVAPAAMQDAGWVVTRSGSELIERQERYRESLEALGSDEEADAEDRELGFSSIETLLVDHLGWSSDQVQSDPNLIEGYIKELPELGETLQPTALVPAASGEGMQLLVQELPLLTPLDQKFSGGEQHWRASAQERFERLLREAGVEAGLLFNGSQLRLVVAPKGESSGHLTFTLKDLAEVSGRLMFSGLDMLLGQSHVFLDPDGYRLVDVLNKSRSYQAVVSNALADQVLAALWDLLRGFERADQLSQQQGSSLLGDIPDTVPEQLYGGLITVLMRFVFLLYAEDEALMPNDAIYEQNYKVSSIFEQLQQDAAEFPDTMEQRFGAWAGLMSLCRLVFDGGGATADYLPARHGQLFDPEPYPWLETPWISDGAVYSVLGNLLVVNGERISYRALDVEQIGSVYEGIMGYEVKRIDGASIGIKSVGQGSKKQLTTTVDLTDLLLTPGKDRKKLVEQFAQTSLSAKSSSEIHKAETVSQLLESLDSRIDRNLFTSPLPAQSLVFQPTDERRQSGSHYTPRSLTRAAIIKALAPWISRLGSSPNEKEILSLRICDPAMGSGAFLVESCRYLAELLEEAWNINGLPADLQIGGRAYGEEPLIYARRLIAQRCVYGVDKNPFAVNLAKLSLWLVSLSKSAPFTFLDHALKCGDSLIGIHPHEIQRFIEDSKILQGELFTKQSPDSQSKTSHINLFHRDSRSDEDYEDKLRALKAQSRDNELNATAGDLLAASFLFHGNASDRKLARHIYSQLFQDSIKLHDAKQDIAGIRARLRTCLCGAMPFHWNYEFPEVFGHSSAGFDVIVGNPPFIGGSMISRALNKSYERYLKAQINDHAGRIDICFYFDLRCRSLLSTNGVARLINTSSIAEGHNVLALRKFMPLARIENKRPWPGDAQLEIVDFCIEEETIKRQSKITDSSSAYDAPKTINPKLCFRGIELRGKGFEVGEEFIEYLRHNSPESLSLIKLYFSGTTLNQWNGGKTLVHCINVNNLSLADLQGFPIVYQHLLETVEPIRSKIKGQLHEESFWKHYDKRVKEFMSIAAHTSFFVKARDSDRKCWQFIDVPKQSVCNSKVIIFKSQDRSFKSVMQSLVHQAWCEQDGSFVGNAFTYNSTLCLETFPFTKSSLVASNAWDRFDDVRRQLMNKRGYSLSQVSDEINDCGGHTEIKAAYQDLCIVIAGSYGISVSYSDFIFEEVGTSKRLSFAQSLKEDILECLHETAKNYANKPSLNPVKTYLRSESEKHQIAQGSIFHE